jgi:hypothetical protein
VNKNKNIFKKRSFLRVRDAEGAEGGAKWSASGMKHGSEADPGASPTAWDGLWVGKPARPKKIKVTKKP